MIIYGTNNIVLKSRTSKTAVCPHCQTQGSITFTVLSSYAHIFWIPMFPYRKRGLSECSHCKQVLKLKHMPKELQKEITRIKDESVSPKWQYAGIGVVVGIIAFAVFLSERDKAEEKVLLETPIIGDVYRYKAETASYSTMKVVDVVGDSVYVNLNDYVTNKMTGVHSIDIPKNYSMDVYSFAKTQLQEMYESGELYDVDRE